MVRLIMGVKGSGKTKHLIELINNAAKDEPGNVVCIEANRNMTYDIHYHTVSYTHLTLPTICSV